MRSKNIVAVSGWRSSELTVISIVRVSCRQYYFHSVSRQNIRLSFMLSWFAAIDMYINYRVRLLLWYFIILLIIKTRKKLYTILLLLSLHLIRCNLFWTIFWILIQYFQTNIFKLAHPVSLSWLFFSQINKYYFRKCGHQTQSKIVAN